LFAESAMQASGLPEFVSRVALAVDVAGLAQASVGEVGDLVEAFAQFGDERSDTGRDHPVASGPRVMASLRNLAIGALHLHGRDDTAEATRWAARRLERPFQILGLTSCP
jgi:hypothetical protein